MDRIQAVNAVLATQGDESTYLEIGVQQGLGFGGVRARTKIGVDPKFTSWRLRLRAWAAPIRTRIGPDTGEFLFACPSDRFFERQRRLLGRVGLHCVLVDGLHTADQSFRDVINSLDWLADSGVIVLHDCNPTSEVAALPAMAMAWRRPDFTGEWNGDVWKTIVRLRATRPDLQVCVLDCDQGVGLVRRGDGGPPLPISEDEIAALSYDDLVSDREHWLNLRPPSHITEFLG
jgi:hypothetical protein